MKKLLVALAVLIGFTVSAQAKEKLYIINSGSTSGTFNAIMSTYAEDLKTNYDVEYVQAKGCAKASAILSKIGDNKAFYISQGQKVAGTLSGKTKFCNFMPTKETYVRSDVKYGMLFTKKGSVTGKELLSGSLKVAYNTNANEVWLGKFMEASGSKHQLVKYKNSKAVVLAVLNGEVDAGLVNSTKNVWKNEDKLTGLFSLNPDGDNGVPPLSKYVSFDGAEKGQVDNFLVQGFKNNELDKFYRIITVLHNSESNVSNWYKSAKGYGSTLHMTRGKALELSQEFINVWVE